MEALTLMLGVWPVLVVEAVVDPEAAGAPHLTQRLQHHVPDTVGALTQASDQKTLFLTDFVDNAKGVYCTNEGGGGGSVLDPEKIIPDDPGRSGSEMNLK